MTHDCQPGRNLTPGTPEHYRDRLRTMAQSVLEMARGRLETMKSIAELSECIELLVS